MITEPEKTEVIVARITNIFKDTVRIIAKPAYAELLPRHFDVVDTESGTLICRVFDAFACHSYNEIPRSGLRVGSIPTLLQFYFGFLYADEHFLEGYDVNRIVCIAQRLVDLASGKRRFNILTPINCLGHQETLRDIKRHSAELKEKTSKNSLGFLKFFFIYKPGTLNRTQKKRLRKNLRRSMKSSDRYGGETPIADLVADKTE